MKLHPLAVLISLGLMAAGCQGGDQSQRRQKTEAEICAELTLVRVALEQVAALQPTSTVGDAQAAEQNLAKAIDTLETSESRLEKLRLESFRTLLKGFRGEVARVTANKTLTLEQAAITLEPKAMAVLAARRSLSEAVKCEGPGAIATPPAPLP